MKNYEKTYKRKSTWEFNPEDDYVKETGDTIVNTIETWVWDDEQEYNGEMGCYILDTVVIAETGEEITLYEVQKEPRSEFEPVKILNNINEAYEYVRKNNESLKIQKEGHEFLGFDNNGVKMYPARATLVVENDGNYYVTGYDYYDSEKEEWIDTEDGTKWTDEEINNTFFPYEVETTDEQAIQETINEYKGDQ